MPIAITVLEKENDIDFIFGLDMLRRHACSIDLKRNVLVIGSTGTELPFLSEAEVGKQMGVFSNGGDAGDTVAKSPAPANDSGEQAPSSATTSRPDEEKISRLMALGFGRQEVINALESTGGNEEFAGALLFG